MALIVGDLAQTFMVESRSVKRSKYAYITSVDLFFGSKPSRGNTSSNLPLPGVTVYISKALINSSNDPYPDLTGYFTKARVEYDNVNISSTTPTTFTFDWPVALQTDIMYSVIIKFDGADTGFSLWRNQASDYLFDSTEVATAVNQGINAGKFFVMTNGNVPKPLHDSDLKMSIKIAKFTSLSKSYRLVNRNYEFLKYNLSTLTGNFIPGEYVFANTGFPSGQTVSVSTQTKTVTGTGTTFQSDFAVGSYIVLNSDTTNQVKKITGISNNTTLTVDSIPAFTNASSKYLVAPVAYVFDHRPQANSITLSGSTAKSTLFFDTALDVHGVSSNAKMTISNVSSYPLHAFLSQFDTFTPPGTKATLNAIFANSSYQSINTVSTSITPYSKTEFRDYSAFIFSRSAEVQNAGNLNNGKSANFTLTLSTDNEYVSPRQYENNLKFFTYKYILNDDVSNENKSYGNAIAKYISKKITLADGQDAEDLRVYLTAFKPQNTDIRVYARLHNSLDSEAFDVKDWSLLELTTPRTLLSNASNPNDFIELSYKLPNYPIANSATGSSGPLHEAKFSGANNSGVFTASTTTVDTYVTAPIQTNDVVRIYNQLTPDISLVDVVTASNSSTFTVGTVLDSSNSLHTSFITSSTSLSVEKVTYPHAAFNNYVNQGVVRYFDNSLGAQDTYKVFSIKIVLTSSDDLYRPSVNDLRGIALTI